MRLRRRAVREGVVGYQTVLDLPRDLTLDELELVLETVGEFATGEIQGNAVGVPESIIVMFEMHPQETEWELHEQVDALADALEGVGGDTREWVIDRPQKVYATD
jgi:hypothetical protein